MTTNLNTRGSLVLTAVTAVEDILLRENLPREHP